MTTSNLYYNPKLSKSTIVNLDNVRTIEKCSSQGTPEIRIYFIDEGDRQDFPFKYSEDRNIVWNDLLSRSYKAES